jgi:hypothetical protein
MMTLDLTDDGKLALAAEVEARDRGQATAPRVKSEPGPPMTLGSAAAAGVRLIVRRWDFCHEVEPDPATEEPPPRLDKRQHSAPTFRSVGGVTLAHLGG